MSNDHESWLQLIKGIKPIHSARQYQQREQPKNQKITIKPTLPVLTEPTAKGLPELTCGSTANIDRNLCHKMDRGEYPIDARLDLHHLTTEQACDKLFSFIENSYARGLRFVLVITGQGKSSEDGRGAIRNLLPYWLNNKAVRPKIVRFCHAIPSNGGQGAVYILLRRHRP